jgi:formylglycine-generating enzyme required for sulfatase activity
MAETKRLFLLAFLSTAAVLHAAEPARREITDSLGVKLVLIPAGEFTMGSGESGEQLVRAFPPGYEQPPEAFADELPRHRVRITRPFWLGKFEITRGQFRQFVEASNYRTEPERDGQGGWGYDSKTGELDGRRPEFSWRNPGFAQNDDHPVVNVTWNDATAFCRWLSEKEGRRYRLPTEAEWEYACRAGTTTRYHNGDDPDALGEVANVLSDKGREEFPAVPNLVFHKEDNCRFTMPGGSFPPNRFGLHDMHGNVWEWCSDWYGIDYYGKSPVDDPTGPASGDRRVRRGGGWNSFRLWPRASFRNWNTQETRCLNLGFRVVCEDH